MVPTWRAGTSVWSSAHGPTSIRLGRFPGRDFGPDPSAEAIDPVVLELRWFDRWLKGIDNGADRENPVKIFVMDADAGPGRHRGHLPAPGPAEVSDTSRKANGPMDGCTSLQ